MKQALKKKGQHKEILTAEVIFGILRDHKELLRKLSVIRIGLFGSYTRGEQKRRSDIDFLVKFEEPTFENFMDLVFSLEKYFGRRVDIITEGSLSPYVRPYIEKEIRWYEI